MSKGFVEFKEKIRFNAIVKCALSGAAAVAAAVGGTLLGVKLAAGDLAWYWYLIIGYCAAMVGIGVPFAFYAGIILGRGDGRIAKRLDKDLDMGERTQTMVEFREDGRNMAVLQREDTEDRLSRSSTYGYASSGLLGFIIAIAVAVALLVTGLVWPSPTADTPPSGDDPIYEATDWQMAALLELIREVRESGMEESARNRTVAQLESLVGALDAGLTENALREKVKGVIAAIDEAVDSVNSFDEIKSALGQGEAEEIKAVYSALGTLTVFQTRESFDGFRALFLGEDAPERLDRCAADIRGALDGVEISSEDKLLGALLTFAAALDSASEVSSGVASVIAAACDSAIDDIAPAKEQQRVNYQMGEHAVERLMSIFGLTATDVGRTESGDRGDYDDDEDEDDEMHSGGIGSGELIFGDDGVVLDVNTGELVKYSELLTEYVRLFNEKRQDGLLDELIEKYGDEYFALLYGSGANQN